MQVLIIDDQAAMRGALELLCEVHGLEPISAASPVEALALIRSEDIGLVIQDMNFGEGATSGAEGLELFRAIRALDPELPVLLMTAWTSLESAVDMVREGAADYFAKPWKDEKLLATIKNLLRMRELAQDNARLRSRGERARRTLAEQHALCGMVYASDAIHDLVALAIKVAPADVPVLITGPNGAGKDRLADVLHANSRRSKQPFVRVNAGGLADSLLEAELFGAEAGAFTGATKLRIGRFEAAHGGTLFLDELGNLSANGQMKLLRVLQSGEFERVGSSTTRKVDVRVISATNADLKRAIADGTFREDLYFRLNVIELAVPALADRPEDIQPLAERVLAEFAAGGAAPQRLADEALRALLEYDWPGNIRELQNRLQRASLVCSGGVIRTADLGLPEPSASKRPPEAPDRKTPSVEPPREQSSNESAERVQIQEALERAHGVVSKAAAELGYSRQALYRRMERLGLTVTRKVGD